MDPGDEIALVVCEVRELLPAVALPPCVCEERAEDGCCDAALRRGVDLCAPSGEAVAIPPVPSAIAPRCCSVESLENFFRCVS